MASAATSQVTRDYDLLDPTLFLDPHPLLRRMREDDPVHFGVPTDAIGLCLRCSNHISQLLEMGVRDQLFLCQLFRPLGRELRTQRVLFD